MKTGGETNAVEGWVSGTDYVELKLIPFIPHECESFEGRLLSHTLFVIILGLFSAVC